MRIGEFFRQRTLPNFLAGAGGSSIFASVEDMAKWAINLDDARVGGEAAMALSRTRVALANGHRLPYAFGLRHGAYRGLATLSHSGVFQGFKSHLLHFPEKKLAVVVLANGGFIDPDKAARDVAEIFLETEWPTTVAASTSAKVTVAAETLSAYAGIYRKSAGQYLKVTRDGDTLKAQASVAECCTTSLDIAAMTARSQTDFVVAPHMLPIAFKRDESGQTAQLTYRGWPYRRVAEPVAKPFADYLGVYDSAELHTSYTVEAKEGALVMRHFRHGEITLNPGWATDFFLGGEWFMKSVEFERGADGKVAGVVFNLDDRALNVRFEKRR